MINVSYVHPEGKSCLTTCPLFGGAFHVIISLRAAEDTIRSYYKSKTGKDPLKLNWKSILNELSNMPKINKALIGYFDYIRDLRNTAAHPDKIFDQVEAEGVFHKVVDMIYIISQEIDT